MSEEIATRPTTGVGIPRSDPGLPFANHSTGHPSVAAEPSHKPASGIPDVTSDAQSAMQIHLHGFPCLYVSEEGDGSTAEPTCEEIEHEIRRCREESDAANINDPYLLAARRAALGIALESRYLHTWDAEDLEERLAMWRAALATLTGPVNAFGASRQDEVATIKLINIAWFLAKILLFLRTLSALMLSLMNNFQAPQLAKSAATYEDSSLQANRDMISLCLTEISRALGDRHLHTFQLSDIGEQIFLCRAALGRLPGSYALRSSAMRCMGVALRIRFEHFCDPRDLEEALDLHHRALDGLPNDHPDTFLSLTELSLSLKRQFEISIDTSILRKAIDCQKRAVQLCPKTHSARAYVIHNLGAVQWLRHGIAGGSDSLKEAADTFQIAVALRPVGHRDRHASLHCLAISISMLAARNDSDVHLTTAISLYQEALCLRPRGHPERAATLTCLGSCYAQRFFNTLDFADSMQSIKFSEEAVDVCPQRSVIARRDVALNNLGACLLGQYHHFGRVADLEKAISVQRDTLALKKTTASGRMECLSNLAMSLMQRYENSQNGEDIAEAVMLLGDGIRICTPDHPRHAEIIGLLAEARRLQSERTGEWYDLDETVALLRASLSSDRDDARFRSQRTLELADALMTRSVVRMDTSSLTQAVDVSREHLANVTITHHRRLPLRSLAKSLRLRFEQHHDLRDANDALAAQSEASALYRAGNPSRAVCLMELARLHFTKGVPYFDLIAALFHLSEALKDQYCNPQTRLLEALGVLDLVESILDKASTDALQSVLAVYRLAIGLLPRVAYFGLGVHSRLKALKKADYLPAVAAMHALSLSQPDTAVEMLEEGRAVFWQQYLRLRSPFDDLPQDLATRLVDISRLLERAADDGSDKVQREAEHTRKRELGEEFEKLTSEARRLPGQTRFLLHDTFAEIREAARNGTVVVFVAGKIDSRAILITGLTTGVQPIVLPNAGVNLLEKLSLVLRKDNTSLRGALAGRGMRRSDAPGTRAADVLEELWVKIMEPVIRRLELQKAEGRSRKRIFMCPTGAFTQLPLHAAGIASTRLKEGLTDYVVPSYTPTLGALLKARRDFGSVPRNQVKLMVAAAPYPPFRQPLHAAVEEVSAIHAVVPPGNVLGVPWIGRATDPLGNQLQSTTLDVLGTLPAASIVHFACHAFQDLDNPLNSGFVLQDETLTMSRLIEVKLSHAFLAVLSACETAKGDRVQPDQAAHLASALMFAGFKSIIGTMWSMGDADGPIIAKKIYGELFAGDSTYLDPEAVPYALDAAVQELQAKGLHPSRWASFVHVGI